MDCEQSMIASTYKLITRGQFFSSVPFTFARTNPQNFVCCLYFERSYLAAAFEQNFKTSFKTWLLVKGQYIHWKVLYDRIKSTNVSDKKKKKRTDGVLNSMIQVWLRAHTVLACVCLRAVISSLHKSDKWGSSWLLMGSEGAQHT